MSQHIEEGGAVPWPADSTRNENAPSDVGYSTSGGSAFDQLNRTLFVNAQYLDKGGNVPKNDQGYASSTIGYGVGEYWLQPNPAFTPLPYDPRLAKSSYHAIKRYKAEPGTFQEAVERLNAIKDGRINEFEEEQKQPRSLFSCPSSGVWVPV